MTDIATVAVNFEWRNVVNDLEQSRQTLQETMNFMAALAAGIEPVIGRGACSMAYSAGRTLGAQFARNSQRTNDLGTALAEVRNVLTEHDCLWQFEAFHPSTRPSLIIKGEDGSEEILLVFRDCMIRQSLFRYGHAQKGSLCYMMYGFFAGALEAIMGRRAELAIIHAGENACLKCLKVHA